MSDDPIIIKLEAECARMNGVDWNDDAGLMQLLNPSKVVNLERDLEMLRSELEETSDPTVRAELDEKIAEKEKKQSLEMRSVMRDWLKAVFVWQSVLSVVVCGAVAYDAMPFFPHLDLSVRVLGFWGIWLFTIPSLRSRKPGGVWGMNGAEKKALDISFLLTPVVNLAMPIVTKNPPDIFWANLVALGACYGYGFLAPDSDGDDDASLPAPIKFALKALDFGAGRERGAPMEMREKMEEQARLEREDRQQRAAQGAAADEPAAAAAAEEPQEVL